MGDLYMQPFQSNDTPLDEKDKRDNILPTEQNLKKCSNKWIPFHLITGKDIHFYITKVGLGSIRGYLYLGRLPNNKNASIFISSFPIDYIEYITC